ncbi:hypothetical protein FRB90_011291 [Tulasnella sp. 427]|nr:hypothetical protein FRB90_011291 [Tulasnella sp. 427]
MSSSLANIHALIETFSWLSSQSKFDASPKKPVPLDLALHDYGPPVVKEVLAMTANLQGLRRLTLGSEIPIATTLSSLATPAGASEGSQYPFPDLEEIHIETSIEPSNWGSLKKLIQSRQADTESRDRDRERPKAIRKLVLGSDGYPDYFYKIVNFGMLFWNDRLDVVRRLLGPEGELIWYGMRVTLDGVLQAPSPS